MALQKLFQPLNFGPFKLPNRIVMAPLTRCRADAEHVPTPIMAEYYAQRASAGLIIAEATMVMKGNSAFWREPGIYSDAHVAGWKRVTDAVHKAGGKIALQLWHGGRACHPLLNGGSIPVAPSALRIENDEVHTPEGKKPYAIPRALEIEEISGIIEGFAQAARYALEAGFDAVEVHAANGYLLDEFLRDGSNKRTDSYGGSISNRAKLLLEVTESVAKVFGKDRVGVRISPLNSYNQMIDSDPVALTQFVASSLSELEIAYLHLMRGDFTGVQKGDVVTPARRAFKGTLVTNMGYSAKDAEDDVASGKCDAIAFGHHFVSNPDLVERVRVGYELVEPDPTTFYTQDGKGYIDYPTMTTYLNISALSQSYSNNGYS
jgi:N-ethylmaleimide reductase